MQAANLIPVLVFMSQLQELPPVHNDFVSQLQIWIDKVDNSKTNWEK